jgi:integration host factor subunit beta
MTRSELVEELAAVHPHLRRGDIELIVSTIFNQISAALAAGGRVELRGFGSFGTKQRNARDARNPRTGALKREAAIADPGQIGSRRQAVFVGQPQQNVTVARPGRTPADEVAPL